MTTGHHSYSSSQAAANSNPNNPLKPLTDDEASKEMKKMVAFIMQEASEKCTELHIRADEEFNIEKAKLVRQETINLEQLYARKYKQAQVKRRVMQSVQVNKARLQVLQARDDALDEIVAAARQQILQLIANDPAVYQKLLNDLLLQCMGRLMDEKVEVTCREQDVSMVREAIKHVTQTSPSNTQLQITINATNRLPSEGAGGIIVTCHNGRIKCDNSLEGRLELAVERLLPSLRVLLYGHSPNRKFFD